MNATENASTKGRESAPAKAQENASENASAAFDYHATLQQFRDPELARKIVRAIEAWAPQGKAVTLMEVCGTHTVSIARNGIKALMPENVCLSSGPGCPVCVTSNHDIDQMIALARIPEVTVTTFGDMMRVPGSTTSLNEEKARGAAVEVVYSPLDALEFARRNPEREVVFIGVGFETTAPTIAKTIQRAAREHINNFSVACSHKTMPRALEVILSDPEVSVDALILPGHVSTIIGMRPYEFLAQRYGIPGVITGFEPVDILQGIAMLLCQLHEGRAEIEIAYKRGVEPEGNQVALAALEDVFEPCDAIWRGLGEIPGSGLRIRDRYAAFDALRRFEPPVEPTREPQGCRCGDVLRGKIAPNACGLYGRVCTPEHPVGPCMVSSEGACAAYIRYYSATV